MNYVIWAVLLVLQSAAQTWVSRARNGTSYSYHMVASWGSNGVWFLSQFFIVDQITGILRTQEWSRAVPLLIFYCILTSSGSVGMHWLSIHYLEKGKRKVSV